MIEHFGQPAYTGENRCLPCTVANTALAAVMTAVIAFFAGTVWSTPVVLAVTVVSIVVSITVIALRGYLVPGTPELTTRYLPDSVLEAFEKQRTETAVTASADRINDGVSRDTAESPGNESSDPETILRDAGAIRVDDELDDLRITDEFRTAWEAEIAAIRDQNVQKRRLASTLNVAESELTFDEYGNAFNARINGSRIGQWESQAALLADLAADAVLTDRYDAWDDFTTEFRAEILYALRSFAESCPQCDGPLAIGCTTVESCCRTIDVVVFSCNTCDARLLELPVEG